MQVPSFRNGHLEELMLRKIVLFSNIENHKQRFNFNHNRFIKKHTTLRRKNIHIKSTDINQLVDLIVFLGLTVKYRFGRGWMYFNALQNSCRYG